MRITKKESNYRTAISSLSIGINRMAEWPLRHVSWSFHVILIFASCRHFAVISCVSSLPRRDLLSPNRLIGHWNSHVQFYNPLLTVFLIFLSPSFTLHFACLSVCLCVGTIFQILRFYPPLSPFWKFSKRSLMVSSLTNFSRHIPETCNLMEKS